MNPLKTKMTNSEFFFKSLPSLMLLHRSLDKTINNFFFPELLLDYNPNSYMKKLTHNLLFTCHEYVLNFISHFDGSSGGCPHHYTKTLKLG